MSSVVNIAAYKFISIIDPPALRERVLAVVTAHGVKGTILIAPEGINIFLAGSASAIEQVLHDLQAMPEIGALEVKSSVSDHVPFGKMRVRLKREIIRMDHPAIQPASGRAPAVDAQTLDRWLTNGHDDSGRAVVMLDTRNAFEVAAGTFAGAIDWELKKFTEFPAAVQAHRAALKDKTVVSFCTGGIRCEKAAIYMAEEGIENVFQLEGGILKYFELVGQRHYDGGCFVFDEREVLDAELAPVVVQAEASAEGADSSRLDPAQTAALTQGDVRFG